MVSLETAAAAVVEGIKIIGVGKKGSRSLDSALVLRILEELRAGKVADVARGAFFGALVVKGVTPDEKVLEEAFTPGVFDAPERLAAFLAPDAPKFIQDLCARLLKGETLDRRTAEEFGDFLFSGTPGDGARGLAASILRVRYETPQEYAGLLAAIGKTITGSFRGEIPGGDPIAQIAEPFDGVDQSYLITPLLARFIQNLGYRAVTLVGRNSGPKYGNNPLELAKTLKASFLKDLRGLQGAKPLLGWHVNQEDMSPALDRWVELRRQVIKRPFLSTLERFVNPVHAEIMIASAFHPPYAEKMIRLCEDAGFPSGIVVRNGREGTLAFPLTRVVKMLCTARRKDGAYVRGEIVFDPQNSLKADNRGITIDEKLEQPSLEENARLVKEYLDKGRTSNEFFDTRVQATCTGIQEALRWVETIKLDAHHGG